MPVPTSLDVTFQRRLSATKSDVGRCKLAIALPSPSTATWSTSWMPSLLSQAVRPQRWRPSGSSTAFAAPSPIPMSPPSSALAGAVNVAYASSWARSDLVTGGKRRAGSKKGSTSKKGVTRGGPPAGAAVSP